MSKKKVVVCMPVQDTVQAQTTQCLIDLLAHRSVIGRVQVEGTLVHKARNHLVKSAIEGFPKATHILFVDDDMVFTPDDLDKLLDSGKNVVGSVCVERNVPFHPCFVPKDKNWANMRKLIEGHTSTMSVDSVGMGFTLVKISILKKLLKQTERPFHFHSHTDYGEDYNFCSLLSGINEQVWVHCGSHVGHIAKLPISLEHFKYNLMNNPNTKELKDSIFEVKLQDS